MNREQRRAAGKGQPDERVDVAAFIVHFTNGKQVQLDTAKILITDKETGRPLFQEVLEPIPSEIHIGIDPAQPGADRSVETPAREFPEDPTQSYAVTFDTPEGKMEYVKNGNWSGVRKAQ